MQVHIREARVIDPQSDFHDKVTDILVEDGFIKDIAPKIKAKATQEIHIDGLCVSPGWVDVFADYHEPGHEHKETIASGLAAAAAGGYTDVLTVPNTQPAVSTKSVVQYMLARAAGNVVSLHPMGSVSQNAEGKDLAEMLDMRAHGATAFTDGWKPVQNAGLLLKGLEYVKAFGGTLVQLPVDAALAAGGLMHEGTVSTTLGMAGIPDLAETMMVHRDIELARYTGSRLHITGISLAASVEMVRRAKAQGILVTCSVTPYHLALTHDALTGYDSIYKVSPPLRTETDRMALIDGIKDGTVDCIASHHRPHEWDAKAKEFEYASDGMAVQENTFGIAWNVLHNYISEERWVELVSIMPRDIFGLASPRIANGNKASLTLFVPGGLRHIGKEGRASMGINDPFIGREVAGKVAGIINNGQFHLNR